MATASTIRAGAAAIDLTPSSSMFLAGYPHVARYSTGVHDPLLSSALCLETDGTRVLIIANDIIYMPAAVVRRLRLRIEAETGVRPHNVLISATHTHSGPKMLDPIATEADKAVPRTDLKYVQFVEEKIAEAARAAVKNLADAEIGLGVVDATGVGTNRRDPNASKDLNVPVMVVRRAADHKPIAAMLVCSMHPTVMHEDSTLISGDFPAMAKQYLQKHLLGDECVMLYHTGPAGNQSPRHVVKGQTFAEAQRLGEILGKSALKLIPNIQYRREITLECRSASVDLPLREFMNESDASAKLIAAERKLAELRSSNSPKAQIRTAEVDWFGAQETLTLARAAAEGRVKSAAQSCMPAEVQAMLIGPWNFIAWPGEMFVEFALEVKALCPNTFLISYANGELQGYLVTRQAVQEGGYESSNAIFKSPESGDLLVEKTLELLKDRCARAAGPV